MSAFIIGTSRSFWTHASAVSACSKSGFMVLAGRKESTLKESLPRRSTIALTKVSASIAPVI